MFSFWYLVPAQPSSLGSKTKVLSLRQSGDCIYSFLPLLSRESCQNGVYSLTRTYETERVNICSEVILDFHWERNSWVLFKNLQGDALGIRFFKSRQDLMWHFPQAGILM